MRHSTLATGMANNINAFCGLDFEFRNWRVEQIQGQFIHGYPRFPRKPSAFDPVTSTPALHTVVHDGGARNG